MLTPFQVATSSRTRVVELGDLRDLAAHDPGDPGGPVAVADQDGLGVEGALDPVERGHLLAVGRGADDQRAVGHPVEVERVQRLRGEQHHVVGDVDDVVDRPLARRDQPRLQPQRGGADRHLGEHAGREARTELWNLHGHRRVVGRLALAVGLGVALPRRLGQRRATERMHLPRHPVHAEAVDAVRADLELQHRLRQRQDLGQRSAWAPQTTARRLLVRLRGRGVRRLGQHDDPVRVVADLELGLGEDHSVGGDAAQLGAPELLAPGHHRARKRHRDGLPGGDVGGAADDRARRLARLHLADAQPVRVGMPLHGEHLADHEAVRRGRARRTRSARPRWSAARAARPAPRPARSGSQYSRSQKYGTLIGTAPAPGRRSRRTCAGRGRRASASRSARSPSRTRSPGSARGRSRWPLTKPNTFGSTIPEPRISIQPVPLQSGSREPSDSCARATAAKAGDVDLDAGLGEREEAGAKARLALGPE